MRGRRCGTDEEPAIGVIRFKPIPTPPARLTRLETIHRAVPLVPAGESVCRRRLRRRTEIDGREEARTWLTFLRALELVERTDGGYRRVREEPRAATLRDRFRRRVYGATEALSALSAADGPLTAREVADRTAADEPVWERHRAAEPERAWRERTGRLLEWCVLFGMAERVEESERSASKPVYRPKVRVG